LAIENIGCKFLHPKLFLLLLQKLAPAPLLRSFVKEYWLLDLAKGSGVPLQMSPIPEQCLYFYPRSLPQPFDHDGKPLAVFDNVIMGQAISGGSQLLVPDGYCMFKILFQPGGMYRLFGTPMSLFANGYEEMTAVLGQSVQLLREQIYNARNLAEMARFSDAFLLQHLAKSKRDLLPIDKAINQQQLHLQTLDQLAADACLSNRQFERKFVERIGVSPKIYQRLIRFNQAMKLKNANADLKWIDITYACGYFDQMHLLRDFKQFTGVTPRIFDFDNALIY
jgi:AraC-like DNA-binding protein